MTMSLVAAPPAMPVLLDSVLAASPGAASAQSRSPGAYSVTSPITPQTARRALKIATYKAKALDDPAAIDDVLLRSDFLGDLGSPSTKSVASFDPGPYGLKRRLKLPAPTKKRRRGTKRPLPALGPPPAERRKGLGEPLDINKLNEEARAASTTSLPKQERALARARTRKRKEASAVVMARRKALLPHLEGITFVGDELLRAREAALGTWWPGDPLYLAKTQTRDYFAQDAKLDEADVARRRSTAERRELESRSRLRPGGLWDLPGTADAKKARKVVADLGDSASTRQRLDLLAEPLDVELLEEYSGRFKRRIDARAAEAERIRVGAAPTGASALATETGVSYDRFSRFAHRCRLQALDDFDAPGPRDRGAQFLLSTMDAAYAAVWSANAALNAPPPKEEDDDDLKPPDIPVVPDVVADMFWRRNGALAPQQAREFLAELEKAERAGCRESALFAGFLSETRSEDGLLVLCQARRVAVGLYSLDPSKPTQPVRDGADGRFGQTGLLPALDQCPLLSAHGLYASPELRDKKSTLYDRNVVRVLLPRRAALEILREVCGQESGAARAREDELNSRGLSARAAAAAQKQRGSQQSSRASTASGTWYFGEDRDKLAEHDPALVKAPHWVRFDVNTQRTLEDAFKSEEGGVATSDERTIDFGRMEQINARSGIRRCVLRDVDEAEPLVEFPTELGALAAKPNNIADELLEKLEREAVNREEVLFIKAPADACLAFAAVHGSVADKEYVDLARLLESLAEFVESALPDDILAYVRFDDDGERLTMVQQLGSAQEDADNAADLEDDVKAARRALVLARAAAQKVGMQRDRLDRMDVAGDAAATGARVAFRTRLMIAEAEATRAQAILDDLEGSMTNLKKRSDATWASLIAASATEIVPTSPGALAAVRRRKLIDGAKRDIARVLHARKARSAPSSIATACRLVAASGARYCVEKAKAAFFARGKEAWSPTKSVEKPSTKKRLIEDEFGPPDNTDLYDAALASGKLDEILKPWVDEQEVNARIIGLRVKSYLWRQRELRIPVVAALKKKKEDDKYMKERRERLAREKIRRIEEAERIQLLRLRRDAEKRRKVHAEAKRALFLENRSVEVELRKSRKDLSHMRDHFGGLGQYLRAVNYSRQFFSRLLKSIVKAWRGFARDSRAEKRSARLMQSLWRMLQAVVAVKAKRAEQARRKRIFDKLFGKASKRRVIRVFDGWQDWAWTKSAVRNFREEHNERLQRKVIKAWYLHARTGPSRRKGLVRKLQKGVRSRLGGLQIMAKLKKDKDAAVALQCLYRGHQAVARVTALRLAKQLLQDAKGREAEAIRMKQRLYIKWRDRVLRHWIRSEACDKLGEKFNARFALRQWSGAVAAYKFERHALHTAASERIAKMGRGYVYGKRFEGLVYEYRMAKRIQGQVRIYMAKSILAYHLERRNASRNIQRVYRAGMRREVIRAWNRHELLSHAYANAARLLIKHNRGARKIKALITTEALIAKHDAAGDSAIHRAARGVGDQAVFACIKHLNLAADAYNDAGSTPLHIIGLDLEPPQRIMGAQKLARSLRKKEALDQKEEREIFLACERMGNPYKNKAERLEELKESGNYVSPEPSPREAERPPTRDLLYGEDRGLDLEEFTRSRPGTAEGHPMKISMGLMDALGTFAPDLEAVPEAPDATDVLAKLYSGSESDMSKSSDEERNDSDSDNEELAGAVTAQQVAELEKGSEVLNKVVDQLIYAGADLEAPDGVGRTPLAAAVDRGDLSLCGVLCERGAQTNALDYAGYSCLSLAAAKGRVLIARLLIKKGANVNLPGRNARRPIHEACLRANRRIAPRFLRVLLTHGSEPDVPDDDGRTPLMHVCGRRHRDETLDSSDSDDENDADGTPESACLQMLLERTVDGNRRDRSGLTTLMIAAKADRVDAVNKLVMYGDVDMLDRDAKGRTALHLAARVGSIKTLKALLHNGHDVRVVDKEGNQAIHAACKGGSVSTVETLVAYDAPMGCRNWAGLTPIGVARLSGRVEVAKFLEDHVAPSSMAQDLSSELLKLEDTVDPSIQKIKDRKMRRLKRKARREGKPEDYYLPSPRPSTASSEGSVDFPPAPQGHHPVWDHATKKWTFPQNAPASPKLLIQEAGDAVASATWDRPIADQADKWVEGWDGEEGFSQKTWTHVETGEVRTEPPPSTVDEVRSLIQAAWPRTKLRKQLTVRKKKADLDFKVGAAEYGLELREFEEEVEELREMHRAAKLMQRIIRRRDAQNYADAMRERREGARSFQRLVRWYQWDQKRLKKLKLDFSVHLAQRCFRGYKARQQFYNFDYEQYWWRRHERWLATRLQRMWRGHVLRRQMKRVRCIKHGPQRFDAWMTVVQASGRAHRAYGIYEEKFFPRAFAHPKDQGAYEMRRSKNGRREKFYLGGPVMRDMPFYYNRVSGKCTWEQPPDWVFADRKAFERREAVRIRGFTEEQNRSAILLQTMWAGRQTRRALKATLNGAKIMKTCEDAYLQDPRNLKKMTQYCLYLHAVGKDPDRARPMYQTCYSRMVELGPDDALVLLSYAIFNAATGDDDWPIIEDCARRGSLCEGGTMYGDRHGYDLADGGFFRAAAAFDPCGWTWHNYAICRWLAFNDMSQAEDCFVRAIQCDPHNRTIQENFDYFLEKKYPNRPEMSSYDVIRKHATAEMLKDVAHERGRLEKMHADPKMQAATLVVQMAWRRHQFFAEILGKNFKAKVQLLEEESSSDDESLSTASEGTKMRGKRALRWERGADVQGRTYYVDSVTGVTQWDEPDDMVEMVYIGKEEASSSSDESSSDDESESEEEEDPRLHPEYEAHADGDHTYFFHVPSGMSTWTRPRYPSPSELATIKQKVSAADPAHVWECCREDGTLFYYNPFTGASQWTHPGPDAVVTFVDSSDDKDEAPGAPDDADSAASPLSGA